MHPMQNMQNLQQLPHSQSNDDYHVLQVRHEGSASNKREMR